MARDGFPGVYLNWECRSLSDSRISSSSSLPIWVSAWDGTVADHDAGSQVWVITRFRVITQTSADMHAGRREPGAHRRLPLAVSVNGQGWGKGISANGRRQRGVAEEWSPGCSDALQKQESLGK